MRAKGLAPSLQAGTCCLRGEEPEGISEHQDLPFLMFCTWALGIHSLFWRSSASKALALHTELLLLTQSQNEVFSFNPLPSGTGCLWSS